MRKQGCGPVEPDAPSVMFHYVLWWGPVKIPLTTALDKIHAYRSGQLQLGTSRAESLVGVRHVCCGVQQIDLEQARGTLPRSMLARSA